MMYEKPVLEMIDLSDNVTTMDIVGTSQTPDGTDASKYGENGVW